MLENLYEVPVRPDEPHVLPSDWLLYGHEKEANDSARVYAAGGEGQAAQSICFWKWGKQATQSICCWGPGRQYPTRGSKTEPMLSIHRLLVQFLALKT